MSEQDVPSGSIRSDLSGDGEMAQLIQYFVEEMPGRLRSLDGCWREQRLDELRTLAHQLKGASAGYGFSVIGDAAKRLEETLRAQTDAERIKHELDALVDLCRRVAL